MAYDKKLREKAINFYEENKDSLTKIQIAKKYNITPQTLSLWLKKKDAMADNQSATSPVKVATRTPQKASQNDHSLLAVITSLEHKLQDLKAILQ